MDGDGVGVHLPIGRLLMDPSVVDLGPVLGWNLEGLEEGLGGTWWAGHGGLDLALGFRLTTYPSTVPVHELDSPNDRQPGWIRCFVILLFYAS